VGPAGAAGFTAADDYTARLWNLRTGECVAIIGLPLVAAATAVDNQLIICCANDMALFER
jgi:WD40 repeat protein